MKDFIHGYWIYNDTPQARSIMPAGDVDWAKLSLGVNSQVTIETSGPSGDTRLWLYDSGLREIAYDDDGGTGLISLIVRSCLPTGTYYLKVDEFGNNDIIPDYALQLTTIAPCVYGNITGRVTQNNASASGIILDLQYYNGSGWSTLQNAITDAGGNYTFANVPGLNSGEMYNVASSNHEANDTRLWRRQSYVLTSFGGSTISGGSFDIQNIYHQSPPDNSTVTLPATFCWTSRNVPNDAYYLILADPSGILDAKWHNAGSGHCYTLSSLPSGYQFGVSYLWLMGVKDNPRDNYDWGASYYSYYVAFRSYATEGRESVEEDIPPERAPQRVSLSELDRILHPGPFK